MKKIIKFILSLAFFLLFIYYGFILFSNYVTLPFDIPDILKLDELLKKYNLKIVYGSITIVSFILFIIFSLKKKAKKKKNEKNDIEKDNSRQIQSINNSNRIKYKSSFFINVFWFLLTILFIYFAYYFLGKDKIVAYANSLSAYILSNFQNILVVILVINILYFLIINHYKKLDILINTNYCYMNNKIKNDNLLWLFYSPYYMIAPLIYGKNDLKKAGIRKFETFVLSFIRYIVTTIGLIFFIIPSLNNASLDIYINYIKSNYLLFLILLFSFNANIIIYFVFKIIPLFDLFTYKLKLNYFDANITKKAYKNKENIFKILMCLILLIISYALFPFHFLGNSLTRINNTNAFLKKIDNKTYMVETLYDVFKIKGG